MVLSFDLQCLGESVPCATADPQHTKCQSNVSLFLRGEIAHVGFTGWPNNFGSMPSSWIA